MHEFTVGHTIAACPLIERAYYINMLVQADYENIRIRLQHAVRIQINCSTCEVQFEPSTALLDLWTHKTQKCIVKKRHRAERRGIKASLGPSSRGDLLNNKRADLTSRPPDAPVLDF
ncbi:hypothetical protein EVAR_60234_1 [Eumeta japonica]|uniref:Uncharacterized protein n=1 Tax=Eumeta variegata TaxID=151549 RepID=A0A4C1Z698_EUMVA|nr:hypothetical protein EVAR_60234_1 [Eumeta japonica]